MKELKSEERRKKIRRKNENWKLNETIEHFVQSCSLHILPSECYMIFYFARNNIMLAIQRSVHTVAEVINIEILIRIQ